MNQQRIVHFYSLKKIRIAMGPKNFHHFTRITIFWRILSLTPGWKFSKNKRKIKKRVFGREKKNLDIFFQFLFFLTKTKHFILSNIHWLLDSNLFEFFFQSIKNNFFFFLPSWVICQGPLKTHKIVMSRVKSKSGNNLGVIRKYLWIFWEKVFIFFKTYCGNPGLQATSEITLKIILSLMGSIPDRKKNRHEISVKIHTLIDFVY